MKDTEIRKAVREKYAAKARESAAGCGPQGSGCCATSCSPASAEESLSKAVGYGEEELRSVPEGSNLGLGCGNPTALTAIREGDTVLDLGSGAGGDCFLAAQRVGTTGRVIGVDMTPEMLERAKENAGKGRVDNVEFRLGEIENLPVEDASVDLIISNCVINLSPDKRRVFGEAWRVLKPGGSILVSDIVLLRELPEALRESAEAYAGCIAGALLKDAYLKAIEDAGFEDVEILQAASYPTDLLTQPAGDAAEGMSGVGDAIQSISVRAVKGGGA